MRHGYDPQELLLIDVQGRYSLQIFKAERAPFSTGNKSKESPDERKAAVMGSCPTSAPSVPTRRRTP